VAGRHQEQFRHTLTFIISSTACALGGALNGIYSGSASITMGEKGISRS
jgi:ABC-type uncharacterized transport system permease subunit